MQTSSTVPLRLRFFSAVLTGLMLCLFSPAHARPASGFVSVKDGRFIDPEGRHLLLHGINIVSKNRQGNYQPRVTEKDFEQLRAWGWNCIRFGVSWDGLEPEINRFDEAYLEKLDGWIALAKQYGFYVFLDMHQDLFNHKYGNGAPDWATLDDGMPHLRGAIWSDAYMISPAVQTVFDNFWANKPCADGVGVQDHFAAAWKKLAERYKDEPAVIAYDLFNEPNIGSGNAAIILEVLNAYVSNTDKLAEGDEPLTLDEVMQPNPQRNLRSVLAKQMQNLELYQALLDAAAPLCVDFESTRLTAMFQRVRDAIRSVDQNHIIFLETNISANMGVPTGVRPLVDETGQRDPLLAYAPHAYDIVVDTHDLELAFNGRLELIFRRHAESGKRLDMPVLIGEWGAFGRGSAGILPSARFTVAMMEKYLMSNTYWDYSYGLNDSPCHEIFERPIARNTSGILLSCATDFEKGSFECRWKEDPTIKAPTCIFLPERMAPYLDTICVAPAGTGWSVTRPYENSAAAVIEIPAAGGQEERTFFIAPPETE